LASTILIDGQLTDWTRIDRLDFSSTSVDGFKFYGRVVNDIFHFALESSTTSIDAASTMWLNTDQNVATGHKVWGDYLGADYKIEFENDLSGVRPVLYSLDAAGNGTLVEGGVSFARSADGRIVELAIDKARIGNATEISTVLDINDSTFLPDGYYKGQYTLNDQVLPVRTDPTLKVAIVFSETSAAHAFSDTAYSQLIMAVQSQAIAAGIPFDILTEQDLTNLSKVVDYDAIIFPSFGFVQKGKASAIEDVLTKAVFKYGISLVAAGDFMTNDETGAVLGTDPYARMKTLLGVERVGGGEVDQITVAATGTGSAAVIGYENETIRTYSQDNPAKVGTSYFNGAEGSSAQVLATQTTSDGTKNAVLTTQTGGNNVFFATESMLADSNMLQHAIGWAARPQDAPELKLQMGRQASIFAARNDMDQSQEYADVKGDANGGIYDKLIPILQQWKAEFDFVGSYYVNIGRGTDTGTGDQRTDWSLSKPFYDQLLSMGNEIGTHSYTHPEDTNNPSVDLQFEFEQSKKVLEEKLGIKIEGAAVPGAPESLETSQKIGQYFEYMTGGYTGVGAGYPSAFGYLTPGSESIYLAPNMKFDFSLVEALPQYGGGMTADEAKAEWIKEFDELSMKSDMPVFVWPWHDYGPTQWMVNAPDPSPYALDMYSDFLRYAHQQNTEFVTMLDLAQRIKAFEQAKFNYSFDSTSDTITATVTANQIGTFALDLEGHKIASVSGWYAYDDDSVFMDADGGTFAIKLGNTPEDVTHITALPSRAELLSITGDGTNLEFSVRGEGKISIDLADPKDRPLTVVGATIAYRNGDKLDLNVNSTGDQKYYVMLQLPKLTVALADDTGAVNDNVTSNGTLNVTGLIPGAWIEYSLNGTDWMKWADNPFIPGDGNHLVHFRQQNLAGTPADETTFEFTLDRQAPSPGIDLPSLNESGEATVTITFDEVPSGFNPDQDLEVVGGKLTDVSADGSGKVYTGTFKVFSNFEGFASVSLKANSYTDKAGNIGGIASDQLKVDTKGPTVAGIHFSNTVIRAGTMAAVTIVFSEQVKGFDNSDVTVESGTLSSLTTSDGGKTWNAVFTPIHDIEDPANVVRVTGVYADQAGNAGGSASSGNYAVDTKSPTVSITQAKLGSSNKVLATFTFSEAVDPSTFTPQDVVLTGAKMESLTHVSGNTFTAVLTPLLSGNGQISVGVNNATYADLAGNAGMGAFKAFGATQAKATKGADWLVGTNGNNTLKGGSGDDIIRGGKGNDTISGDGGKDLLDFSDGRKGIKITLSQENSKYTTFDGRSAGLGVDKYRDMEGVIGTKYADTITGSSSADTLAGLGGNDILRGGRGNDVFVFESNGGRDRIMDFEDTGKRHDKLDVRFFDFDVTSSSFSAWKADHVKQQGSHTIVSFDSTSSVTLMNIKAKAIGFDDFLF
jgi:Ca2+-binding RTX toxin-like protein/peptidoglycan/xylan/chitin deacetylase (PgdA/CDA1 family)